MTELASEVKELKKLVSELMLRIELLEAENQELRRQLGRNSSNSHEAPSSDRFKKQGKRQVALAQTKKAKGGQKGHKGKTLKRITEPDEIVIHKAKQCCSCEQVFDEAQLTIISSRQVFDLPAVKLNVTEHRLAEFECCGQKQRGKYPADVNANVQYGSGVRALVSMMSTDYRLPLEKISQYFSDIYGYELNSSTILSSLERGYTKLAATETRIKAQIQASAYVHFDETSLRCDKQRYWLHTASTPAYTHLFVHQKRGGLALRSDDSVIKDFKGFAIHDCWSSYFSFDCKHALCGAHLLRELTALIEQGSVWAAKMHAYLMKLYRGTRPLGQTQQEGSLKAYQAILKQAQQEEPLPQQGKRGRPKLSIGRALLNRFTKHQDAVHAFAFVEAIPFTNNQAERDIRPLKVKLKVCGTFRSLLGAKIYARFQAVISTLRKQNINVFTALRDLFALKQSILI